MIETMKGANSCNRVTVVSLPAMHVPSGYLHFYGAMLVLPNLVYFPGACVLSNFLFFNLFKIHLIKPIHKATLNCIILLK